MASGWYRCCRAVLLRSNSFPLFISLPHDIYSLFSFLPPSSFLPFLSFIFQPKPLPASSRSFISSLFPTHLLSLHFRLSNSVHSLLRQEVLRHIHSLSLSPSLLLLVISLRSFSSHISTSSHSLTSLLANAY